MQCSEPDWILRSILPSLRKAMASKQSITLPYFSQRSAYLPQGAFNFPRNPLSLAGRP